MINNLKVWSVPFDPFWNRLQRPLQVAIVVPDNRAGDSRRPMQIIMLQLGGGNIELALQPYEQRFKLAAFLFQGVAAGEIEFDRDDGDVHALSLDRMADGHKKHLLLI
ncbi:MAG: hypothetical protein U9N80_04765 [Chloroflexota bacterium]|nr:hypothetical protein [Chloroflexota bacterium]